MKKRISFRLKRMARRLFWPRPSLYAPFSLLRGHGNVLATHYPLYICGYPRSGNTFALKAFQSANPNVLVRSHKHIPAFAVQSVRINMPGMLLIRNPVDAGISWSIFTKKPLWESLAYYNDYYSVLLPYRDELMFVSFEEVISDFGKVTEAFNARWGTDFIAFEHTPKNVARCMKEIESDFLDPIQGRINESRVARPSLHRKSQRQIFLPQLNHPIARVELKRANELYHALVPAVFTPRPAAHRTSTQHIHLRPAV